jgi:hypothetical protein
MATDPARPEQPATPPNGPEPGPPGGQEPPKKHRSRWVWVSAVLGLAVVGLLVWALSLRSDLDDANAKNEQQQETGNTIAAAARDAYDSLASELGATNEDLADTEQQLDEAQQAAEDAQQDADAAKQTAENTSDELDKAKAEADQAKAEAEAAGSKVEIAGECAKAYVNAAKGLLDGGDGDAVREQMQGITDDCRAAFAEAE